MSGINTQTTDPAPNEQLDYARSALVAIRGIYTTFVQNLFYLRRPGDYHWNPDDRLTDIYITNEVPIKEISIQVRPGITFTRTPVFFYSLGFNDDLLGYEFRTGQKRKSLLIIGAMVVNVVSKAAMESEALANDVAHQLWARREDLIKQGLFEVGRQVSVGSPSPAGSIVAGDKHDEYVVTSFTSPFQYVQTTYTTPVNVPMLSGINVDLEHGQKPRVNPRGYLDMNSKGGELPFGVKRTRLTGGDGLPKTTHPLNPNVKVVVTPIRTGEAKLRPIAGRELLIPIDGAPEDPSSKQSFKVLGS